MLSLMEVKASRTVRPDAAHSISLLKKAIGQRCFGVVVYQGERSEDHSRALHPDARAITPFELDTVIGFGGIR
jgi:hypothetical protein